MKMKKIDINIGDIKIFTDLAFMLDRESVVKNIIELRKCWNLDKELIPVKKLDEWIQTPHVDFRLTSRVYDRLETIEEENHFGEIYIHNAMDKQKLKDISEINHMWFEIEYLLKGNGIHIRYKNLVLKAIVCGEIDILDWKKAQVEPSHFIHKNWMFNMLESEKTYKGDTKPEVIRDREWYWLDKNGIKQIEIATTASDRGKRDPEDYLVNVKKGIQRYKSFLESQGTFSYN